MFPMEPKPHVSALGCCPPCHPLAAMSKEPQSPVVSPEPKENQPKTPEAADSMAH